MKDCKMDAGLSVVKKNNSDVITAVYRNHPDAEAAIRLLAANGIPMKVVSLIGRNFEADNEVYGFHQPSDATSFRAAEGAWLGGIFGLVIGATGFFVFPVIGALVVLGPLSEMIAGAAAGACAGAGLGALVSGLMAAGISKEKSGAYQSRLQRGEFLLVVHGSMVQLKRMRDLLAGTLTIDIEIHLVS